MGEHARVDLLRCVLGIVLTYTVPIVFYWALSTAEINVNFASENVGQEKHVIVRSDRATH